MDAEGVREEWDLRVGGFWFWVVVLTLLCGFPMVFYLSGYSMLSRMKPSIKKPLVSTVIPEREVSSYIAFLSTARSLYKK